MSKEVVSTYRVSAAELPAGFADNPFSGRMVQSRSIAEIGLSAEAAAAYAAAVREVRFHSDLTGAGVEVAVSGLSAPHRRIAPVYGAGEGGGGGDCGVDAAGCVWFVCGDGFGEDVDFGDDGVPFYSDHASAEGFVCGGGKLVYGPEVG